MTEIGTEFVLIRPSLAGFKAELQAQVAAALAGVGPQIAAAQSRLRTTAGTATLAGLPATTNAAATAQTKLATTTRATNEQLALLSTGSQRGSEAVKNLTRDIQHAETAAGRTARGLVAATAASTGFFRAVSFASGAFLIGAAAGAAIASGVQEFRNFTIVGAQTAAILKATGDASNVTAGQIEDLAKKQLNLTGVDDELVKSAANVLLTFRSIRNEVGAGNDVFTRSVKAVQDISSVFGTALTGSAVQLGKALQDPIRGVTALRRSGITLSQSQRDLIKRLVETGQLLTAQKIILGEVEHQVGGTAAAIGRTLPGQLDVLKERAKNALGDFVARISESQKVTQAFSATMTGLGDALHDVFAVVKAGGGALVELTRVFASIPGVTATFQALGGLRSLVRTLAIAAAAFGGLKLALAATTAAQGLYTRATTVATAATAAEGAAATGAAERISLGAAALGALRGPLGITLGITALAVGFIKLRQAAANAPGTLQATEHALRSLNDAVEQGIKLQNQLAGRREDVSLARFDVQAAQRTVAQLQARAAASGAQPGSLAARDNANQIAAAVQKQKDAEQALAQAEQIRDRTLESLNANERQRPSVIQQTNEALQKQLTALRRFANAPIQSTLTEVGATNPRGPEVAVLQAKQEQAQLAQTQKLLEGLAGSGDRVQSTVGKALLTIQTTLNKIPSNKQITIAVRLAGEGQSENTIVRRLLGIGISGETIRQRGLVTTATDTATLHQQRLAAEAALHTQEKALATLRQTAATRKDDLNTSKQQVTAAQQALQSAQDQQRSAQRALADAKQAARESRQNLIDTIAAGRQAINDAVTSAKSNLDSLGQTIAQALGQTGSSLSSALSPARFRQLRSEILAGGGGPETQLEAQRLANQASQGGAASNLPRQFADLTDALDRGKISLPQFNRQLTALLKGIDFKALGRSQGTAFVNTLRDEIAGARRQASLIAGGPQRPGGGNPPSLVQPLRAVAQAGRDIAAARRDLSRSLRGITDSQRDLQRSTDQLRQTEQRLRTAETRERRANTRAIAANTRASSQLADVLRARKNLNDKPKPKGTSAKDTGDLSLLGATSP